ncbi:SDR family NAD(P)-dependent oxidoreductase [Synechococcus sp. KORDI-100]|uniref:SDR family NAD(P)-dependent oxidoreductase n=1 Tax=Synechococcus sp. KORDI-100 TaxID=1280380 RepID=UPI00056F1049|nr:SDR family NAD(P)-dependent oxidoreductase [Synechococcus sp. KORDI-100]
MKRTVMISGASRGIGCAIAERLLNDGHNISLGVRDPDRLRHDRPDLVDVGEDRVLVHPYHACDPASAEDWVAATTHWRDELTALVHCAGILRRTGLLFSDGEEADLDDLWRVNVMGPWWLTRAAWSSLSASGEGRIQVLVSMSGKRSKGRMAGYPVSKFALMALCQTMRNEGWDAGIRVTAFCPSWVNTEMATSISRVAPEAMTQPQDLASLSSTLLQLPNAAVPFELMINCSLET